LVTNTIPDIEASLSTIRNAIASLAAQLANVKTDVAALVTLANKLKDVQQAYKQMAGDPA